MIFELIEYYCIYISTLLLIISPIYSFKYKLYKFCFFQTIVCITSILNHYKLYKYGRHIDVPIVWITVTYHYIQYYRLFQRNIYPRDRTVEKGLGTKGDSWRIWSCPRLLVLVATGTGEGGRGRPFQWECVALRR